MEPEIESFSGTGCATPNGVLCVSFLEWQKDVRGRTYATVRAYGATLEALVKWAGPRPLMELTTDELEQFTVRRRRGTGGVMASAATRKKDVSILRSFYGWAEDRSLVDRSPARMLHGPTVHNIAPRPLDDDVWVAWWTNERLPDSMALVLGLGFFCGLRRSEILALQCNQITPTRIKDFRRKGGGKDQALPWGEMLATYEERLPHLVPDHERFPALMGAVRGDSSDLVLKWATTAPDQVNKRITAWAGRLDLPTFTPHQLRHSTATNLLRAGVPLHLVSRLMNHANTQTTMRYVRAGGDELREWRTSQR